MAKINPQTDAYFYPNPSFLIHPRKHNTPQNRKILIFLVKNKRPKTNQTSKRSASQSIRTRTSNGNRKSRARGGSRNIVSGRKMPKLSNADPYHTIYNSTISTKKPKYGDEYDYFWDADGQELADSTFPGVKGRVALTNQNGRLEGDDLVAPFHWD